MTWHVWHRARGVEKWCHEKYSSQAEAALHFNFWVMAGHQVQIKEGSDS